MLKQGLFCLLVLVVGHFEAQASDKNVILLMLDGVRWQEVFKGVDPSLSKNDSGDTFPFLLQELAREGMLLGNRDKGSEMTVSNSAFVSLPAYQSIMAGTTQPCGGNGCGRIKVETLQERIVRELGLEKTSVASIASWEKIPDAVEHLKGSAFVNAAFQPLEDGTNDAEFARINVLQGKDAPPWSGARFDRYTWAHATHYLQKYRPRFMFISLNDSDEWGHKGEYPNYVATLRQYDAWIRELTETLKRMGAYGENTTLIVTTDHGRGEGGSWKHHGWIWPSSKYVWLYGRPAGMSGAGVFANVGYQHLDIRPTIEAALGLNALACKQCGRPIRELLPRPASDSELQALVNK